VKEQMDTLLRSFRPAAAGASLESIVSAAERLETVFPPDYVALLQDFNGGEGEVGTAGYLQLWPIEQLIELNEAYKTKEYFPGFVFVGSDGGGEAIAIRKGTSGPELFLMPFIANINDAVFGGHSFFEFLSLYGSGRIWDRKKG
jgi:hypothetical protein